ncbi:hypothetical protein ACEUZ9_001121 [Paracoccus litorisediminis]|uniref:ADP-ribosyltransferase-containing protein n=1 Tax=Paracoccus litorisediminis TaxID=2006130 RepID=UPI00373148C0
MSSILFHGTDRHFDCFDLMAAGRRSGGPSGALGIWACPDKDAARRYTGEATGYVYEIHASDERILRLPISWLHDVNIEARRVENRRGTEEALRLFDTLRREFQRQGYDQIWFFESDHSSSNRVILDPETISIDRLHVYYGHEAANIPAAPRAIGELVGAVLPEMDVEIDPEAFESEDDLEMQP